jgi:hypothetical protein
MASLIRTSLRTGLRASSSAAAPLTFTRGKATLPDLACTSSPRISYGYARIVD